MIIRSPFSAPVTGDLPGGTPSTDGGPPPGVVAGRMADSEGLLVPGNVHRANMSE